MKKQFFQWLGLGLLLLMLPITIQAQSLKTTIFVDESFETGMPSDWTQEYSTDGGATWTTEKPDGGLSWATESGSLKRPEGAYGAGKGRAYLHNETGQTVGARVRLITPVMNILKDEDGRSYYQPILRFAHAQDKWTADFDTLRVYYRAGAKQAWVPIVQYLKSNANWEWVEVDLPMPSETYQIAFDASENLGRGIVLDSVMVRTKPQCTVPSDLFTSEMANNGVTINWNASEDAEGFCVLMIDAKKNVDVNLYNERKDIPDSIIMHIDTTKNGRTFTMRYEKMKDGANVNVWVRSICEGENSSWSAPLNIHMPSTKQITYVETFNIPTQKTTLPLGECRLDTWQYGGTWAPFTSAWLPQLSRKNYSPDATDALLFIGGTINSSGTQVYTEGKTISMGSNAYVVSPEIADTLANTPILDMQVSFWMTLYQSATRNNARGIIVGVMTDKNDITTFVPVDTCTMWGCETFEEFIVSLDKYTGNGHFIAFLSEFDKPNMVAIDSVTISKRPAIGKVTKVHANAQDTCATITWKAVQGAAKYEVLIADSLASEELRYKSAEAIAQLEEQNKVVTASVNTNSFTTDKLKPSLWDGRNYYRGLYYVYVRAEGGEEWSNVAEFVTAAQQSLPMSFTFEDDFGYYSLAGDVTVRYPAKVNVYSNDPDYPHLVTDLNHTDRGKQSLYMIMDAGCDTWITFPTVEEVTKAQISFYMTANTPANSLKSRVVVGVMTDPSDINTFTGISAFNGFKEWTKCQTVFSQYQGTGKYIAIRWQEPEGQSSSIAWIDDVVISEAGECAVPFALSATNNGKIGTFTWQGNAESYNIKIGTATLTDDDLKKNTKANMVNETVSANTYTLETLQPGKVYYFYVQAVCDGVATEWSSAGVLKTDCFAGQVVLPYTQDFEGIGTGSGLRPSCWLCTPAGNNGQYPNLATNYNHTPGGAVCLNMYSTTSMGSYIAMPEFEGNIQDMMVSLWMAASYPQDELFVGVMTDPMDYGTFEKVATLHPTVGSVLEQKSVSFDDYSGSGRYIAFSSNNGKSNTIFIDDVEVSSIACRIPFNFKALTSTESTMTVTWEGRADKWEVLAAKHPIPTKK